MSGFFDLGDGIKKGKGMDALKASKNSRADLIAMFGGVGNLPSSVMRAQRTKGGDEQFDEHQAKRGYVNTSPQIVKGKLEGMSKEMIRSFRPSGSGCGAGALSAFPQNIGRTVVLLYSNPGQHIFDPFAGHNSRMDLVVREGRHYTGCDLSTEFMEFNVRRAEILRGLHPGTEIVLHHTDSRSPPVKSRSADFTLTSPPYWDIEYYGDEPEQLGFSKTYVEFMDGIEEVLEQNFRILRPGAYAAWFINDFRKDGVFYPYHADLMRRGENVGFRMHDLMVVDLGPGIRDIFLNQTVEFRILPKRHEYGIIFKKPE